MQARYPLMFAALLLNGCFSPGSGDDDESSGGATEGSTETQSSDTDPTSVGGMTSTATDPDPDTTADSTDDATTNGEDTAPTVELSVNGSMSPGRLSNSAIVPLEATATDDGMVTQVQFFDGDQLLATVDTAPFTHELLVTSADTGMHEYTARATDDADQEGESDPVTLAVNIDGGSVVASETGLFQMGGLFFHPGIGAVIDADENVIVAGTLATADFDVVGMGMVSLSPDLSSTNWQVSEPASLVRGEQQYLTMGQPWLSGDGSSVLLGGNTFDADDVLANNVTAFEVTTDGTVNLPFFSLLSDPEVQNVPMGGLVVDSAGDMILHGPDASLTKVQAGTNMTLWQSDSGLPWTLSDSGGHRLRTDQVDDIIFNAVDCDFRANSCDLIIRKIRGFDGVIEWDQSIGFSDDLVFMHFGGSVPGPEDDIVTLFGLFPPLGGGMRMVSHNSETGSLQGTFDFGSAPDQFSVADLAFDPQGHVVATGTRLIGGNDDNREAFIMRFSVDGDLLWQEAITLGSDNDQAMALTVDNRGHVVVVGASDIELGFFTFLGDVWVVQLDL